MAQLRSTSSAERRSLASRIGAIQRHNPGADVTELRRRLGFCLAYDTVQAVMDKFPPFSEEQTRDLINLIRSARVSSAHGEVA